jgi:DnaJ-domain-containing protein 1
MFRRTLVRGELPRVLYRLGRGDASGVVTIHARLSRAEVFVLRRGAAVVGEGELARKALIARLARLSAQDVSIAFEGGVTGVLPVGATHGVSLAGWARDHLEAQLDSSLADRIVGELAGVRLAIRTELAPTAVDEADRRMLIAMSAPRRLDQIWPLARTPRFRLLAFLHFLRAIDAIEVEGIVAERSAPIRVLDPRRAAALRLLGVDDADDAGAVKRAYRRLARALHPDLQPHIDDQRRRTLERRFAEVTAAYEALT